MGRVRFGLRMIGAPVDMLMGGHMHITPCAVHAPVADGSRFNLERFDQQTSQLALQVFATDAKIQKSRQNHIATGTAHAVEMEVLHAAGSPTRLISAAATPAPKPLSILTTVIPGAQELSIASRAARPLKLTPYPMLVGTATIGRSTSPPTTDGKAPSMPA